MDKTMVTVEEAKLIVAQNIVSLSPVEMPLTDAAGHILAQNIYATIDIPAFQQSSMDGYALKFEDRHLQLIIKGEMVAGTSEKIEIATGEAVRIFTGAPLPAGADTVVMQEKITLANGKLIIEDASLKPGNSVRNKGSEIKAGALAMQQHCYLSPAAIGFLAGIGLAKIPVYPMPSVSIIVTGKELQKPGKNLSAGQVYESNSYSLTAALQEAGIKNIKLFQADDDLITVKNKLEQALESSDIVLLTGGVSVGDYDFVVEAAGLCGVEQQFHKVKQRPGKPLYFGTKNAKLVFGLPGNPSSVLSCFYNYVLMAIEMLSNKKSEFQKINALLATGFVKYGGLTQFLKGSYKNGVATPLTAQESFQLSSFAQANCLICLEEARGNYIAGETVEVFLLPGKFKI